MRLAAMRFAAMRLAAAALAVCLVSIAYAEEPSSTAAAPPPPGPHSAWVGIALATPGADYPGESDENEAAAPQPGVRVENVFEGGPAADAGLRASDRILSIGGTLVNTPSELLTAVRSLDAGSDIALEVMRGKSTFDLSIRSSSRPRDFSQLRFVRGWIGIRAIELPPSLRTFFGAPADSGVLVSEVVPDSPAEAAGIQVGDTVFAVGERRVRSADEIARLATIAGVENKVEVHVARYGAEIVVEATVGRMPEDLDTDR